MKKNASQLGRPDAAIAVVAQLSSLIAQDEVLQIKLASAF
jgi:hypothetical protein